MRRSTTNSRSGQLDKTVVYCGEVANAGQVYAAWKMLKDAKAQDPVRFDYIIVEDRLQGCSLSNLGAQFGGTPSRSRGTAIALRPHSSAGGFDQRLGRLHTLELRHRNANQRRRDAVASAREYLDLFDDHHVLGGDRGNHRAGIYDCSSNDRNRNDDAKYDR